MVSSNNRARGILLGLGSVLAATSAAAQEAKEPALEEVVVTAERREASSQDVPIAITAIDGDQLSRQRIQEARDLATFVPNIRIESPGGRGDPRVNLRGIGTQNFNPDAAQTFGFYQDEVYLNTSIILSEPYYDIERLEVLRGPQGTLYGKNTTGGALNIITRRPTQDFEGYGRLTYGRFNQVDVEGAVSGPIVDDVLTGRLAVTHLSRDGWVTNQYGGDKLKGYEDTAARVQFLLTPTDDLSVLLKGKFRDLSNGVQVFHSVGTRPDGSDAFGAINPRTPWEINSNVTDDPAQNFHSRGLQTNINYDMGWAGLTVIGSYDDGNYFQLYDDDGGPADGERSRYWGDVEQTTFETRLASKSDQRLTWIVGYHYFDEDLDSSITFVTLDPTTPYGVYGEYCCSQSAFNQKITSHAVFGSSTFNFTDQFSATLGVRYTAERRHGVLNGRNYLPNPQAPYDSWLSALTASDFSQDESRRWTEPTGDFTLAYKPTEHLNFYAKYARGFKGGGFNSSATSAESATVVEPEIMDAYEVGMKSTWLSNRLRINAAAFYYDYKDLQFFQYVNNLALLSNATDGKFEGVEFEIEAVPIENLLLRASAGFVETSIGGFEARGVDGNIYPIEDNRFPGSPESTLQLFASYRIELGSVGDLTLQTNWARTGKIYGDAVQLTAPEYQIMVVEPYWRGDVSAAWTSDNGSYEVQGWMRNVTGDIQRISAFAFRDFELYGITYNEPRTYGVTVTAHF